MTTTTIRTTTIVSTITMLQTRFVTHKLGLFLLFLGFFNIAHAQCDFDINLETTNSTCPANGSIKVTLSGNKIDLSNVLISMTNGATINEQTSTNGHTFGSLPPGNYSITAQSVLTGTQTIVTCYDATTIMSEYTSLTAIITDKRSSLNCFNSGIINIDAQNGRLPYKIKIISKPAGYTGETSFTATSPGLITFNSGIAPGNYIFEVSDDCEYTRSLNVTIDKLNDDFPSTPFDNALYPSGCKNAYLNENSGGSNIYWDSYRSEFYEIAFTFDDSEVKTYSSANSGPQFFELPDTYKKMYAEGKKMKVYIRLKGTECERYVGEFQFSEPPQATVQQSWPDKYCNNYSPYFYLENEHVLCPQYKWEIFDGVDLVAHGEDIDYFGTQSAENLSYNTNYTLKVTDANGTELVTTLSYTNNPPYLDWEYTSEYTSNYIYSYDLNYNIYNICMPYKWEVFDADSLFIKDMDGLTDPSGIIEDLEYNKEYIINIYDDSGNIISFHYKKDSPERYINIFFGGGSDGWTCETYNITIQLTNITTPYTWYVMKKNADSTLVSSGTGTDENNILTGLIYDSAYIIKVTDGITTVYKDIDKNSIQYSPSWGGGDFDYQCNDYAFHFRFYNLYCYPYKWRLVDENNNFITGKENLNTLDYDTVRLEYDKEYRVFFTDSKDREWWIPSYRADDYAMKPYIDWRDYEDRKCTDYKFSFEPYNVNCFPFKWEIFDSDNNSVADSTDLTKDELGVTFSLRLEANKDYTVKITDAKGRESSYPQRVNMESTNFNFYQSSYISNCVDGNGYIEIYGQMDSATRVRFVSGPQTPVHADTVFQEYTYNFYPFSQDHYPESLSMTEGDYVFEITDKCGGIHPITVPLKKSLEISGFSYTADEISGLCNSGEVRIYPHGKIYNNGNPVETWFSLIGTPDNPYHPDYSEKDISENDNSSYFSLTTKGKYVIGIRRMDYNYWWLDCVIDTIVIDHVPKEFTLEGRSSYVCETGTIGHIRVQAINGKLPYIYTLYNQDRATLVEGIEPNGTGAFEYGAFGEKYSVKVQDDCGTYFWIDVEITTLDQTTLLSGKTDICKDGSIELSCLLLGATEYRWSGPNDFSANTRTISIPNVTAVNSGEYTIEVKPAGCDKFFSSSINIKVHEVPLPDVLAPIDLCQADADLPLTIEPAAGYSIKWYDKDENPLSEAPIIDLRVFDDYVFHVEHVDNVFNCVGEKREVQAKVNPLPEKNAKATGWSCQDENPGITVTDVVEGYVYTVFADATATNPVMTFAGTADETMNLTLTATVRDDSTFYLQTATAAGCTLSPGIVAFQVEVDLLKMAPAKLPVYFHEVPYSVQLTGNIENPVFTRTDGSLVTGLSMTSEGLISGTVPASAGYAESTFTVTMNDENGCKTSNTYSLSSCGPAPEISDAELSYCEGSQSVPLEALSPNGFPLKWYDAEMNELSEAPTPATNIAGDQIFYVAQIDEALQCESAKAEIKVTVTPAPELDFEAQSDNICYGSSPTINLANLHSNYVYDIYSDAQMTEKLTSFTGSTSGNLNLSAVPETSTSYYVLVTDDLTCMSINMEEVSINVIKLEILPDDLPVYFHETPYSVQLESNAEEPAFAYAGSLVTGIDMTSGGLISGTVPLSAGREESTFTVTVKDKNGCQTDKEYTLRTCEPKPDLPVDSIAYCAGAQATPIQASSPNGFPLQWYDYNLNKLQETPVPETDNVGEQTFYVAQINEILHCEGERAKVRVFVNPLPEIDFTASANDICFGESPSIILDNLHETYTYTVYSDSEFLNERGSTTGTDSTAVDIDDVLETNTSYYVLVTDSLGCTSSNWKEAPVTVIKLYIEPERLPQYQKNVEYEQRLTTNAQLPMFSIYAGYLPEGFSLNASGLLYGMFSGSTNNMRHVFTVEVQDSNGCNATREYTFTGEVIAPKAFTPNGDGVNDIFMQGYKVVIFDRLGIEMFRGDDGWDGTYKGKPVAPDIYFYKLEYLDANDDVKTKTGYVGVHY